MSDIKHIKNNIAQKNNKAYYCYGRCYELTPQWWEKFNSKQKRRSKYWKNKINKILIKKEKLINQFRKYAQATRL